MIATNDAILRASKWCYSGAWSIVTNWLRVPERPPSLAGADDAEVQSFRPAVGFLRYLKLFFWIGLFVIDVLLFTLWLVLIATIPWLGILLTIPIWAIMIVPDVVVYIAIHLRYDTTWYVLSDRSMRIRRGIWIIHETTITYDNIQNVSIKQGPVQRYFGISDVVVETAGGGAAKAGEPGGSAFGHSGLLEGIANADEVRNLLLAKWRGSKSVGLGDESVDELRFERPNGGSRFDDHQLELLESIRDLAIRLSA